MKREDVLTGASQARDCEVRFVACGNTMTTLGWKAAGMLPFASVEEAGAAVLRC